MSIEWSIRFEIAGDPEEEALDLLMERADAYAAVVGGGVPGVSFGVRLSIEAARSDVAHRRALEVVTRVARAVGIATPLKVLAVDIATMSDLVSANRGIAGEYLVGLSDIAREHGFSRQRAHELATHPVFPAPVSETSAGRVWRYVDVERFLARKREPGRPRRATG